MIVATDRLRAQRPDAADIIPLVSMRLLDDHNLNIEVKTGAAS